ncbi:hypothetical protein PR048_000493 [Dryococelus australis]|uniref:Uncharacterized protein n=1 Tax=Dryococelus australis TaxID=614101 RepID=A0ABQ9IES4_9NEOP|nr:hypothetical protein PR048_000493 [Dryococelus australis]
MLERLVLLKEAVVSKLAMSNAAVECFTNTEWKLLEGEDAVRDYGLQLLNMSVKRVSLHKQQCVKVNGKILPIPVHLRHCGLP